MKEDLLTPNIIEEMARMFVMKHSQPCRYIEIKVHPHVAKDWWPRQKKNHLMKCIGTLLQAHTDIYEIVSITEDWSPLVGRCYLVKAQEFLERPCPGAYRLPVEF